MKVLKTQKGTVIEKEGGKKKDKKNREIIPSPASLSTHGVCSIMPTDTMGKRQTLLIGPVSPPSR